MASKPFFGRLRSGAARFGAAGLASILLSCALTACSHHGNDTPALQGDHPAKAGSAGAQGFALVAGKSDTSNSTSAITLHFSAPLATAQAFDQQIAVTGPNGEVITGSWSMQDDGKTLSFPFVSANTHYAVLVRAGLLAADGRTLGQDIKRDIYSGDLKAAVGFASTGSVLPARGSRGLPLVSVNVHDADVEFFRVHDNALSDLFCLPQQQAPGRNPS